MVILTDCGVIAVEHAKRIVSLETEIGKVREQAGVLRDRALEEGRLQEGLAAALVTVPSSDGDEVDEDESQVRFAACPFEF